jgi:hypothetical protein
MKKIILPNGSILLCQAIVLISRLDRNEFRDFFTITHTTGTETIRSKPNVSTKNDLADVLRTLIIFLDNNELLLNLEEYK